MIKYATIGTSFIAEQFVTGANATDKLELTAVYSRKYNTGLAFAQKFDCNTVYTDLRDLASDKNIDAVYVASPNVFHAGQCELLLNAASILFVKSPLPHPPPNTVALKQLPTRKVLFI